MQNKRNKINDNIMKIKLLVCTLIVLCISFFKIRSNTSVININSSLNDLYKTELIDEVDSYIEKYAKKSKMSADNIVELALKYDYDIPLMLAQFHLESHFASLGIAYKTNNVANVGNMDDGTILYKFKHPDDSVEPYIKLIINDYLKNKSVDDLLNNFVNYRNQRYASDVLYENKVKQKRNYIIKNTKIYKLQKSINNLKIVNKYELEY